MRLLAGFGTVQPVRDMTGEKVLITAGPTFEPIDPVRGFTNRSSGKMGYAIAGAALERGASVTIVSGPVSIDPPVDATTIKVRTAEEMYEAVMQHLPASTLVVMAAAVADYRPASISAHKLKKSGSKLVLELEPTADILAAVGSKKNGRLLIGFAAETQDLLTNARKKLESKNADLIIANDVSSSDSGFDVDTNRITILSRDREDELPLMTKTEAAGQILDAAMRIRAAKVQAAS
jgi:phosphopantothenoylcysteine decarboxylase/phosphopantothenate--cysteine ligase